MLGRASGQAVLVLHIIRALGGRRCWLKLNNCLQGIPFNSVILSLANQEQAWQKMVREMNQRHCLECVFYATRDLLAV